MPTKIMLATCFLVGSASMATAQHEDWRACQIEVRKNASNAPDTDPKVASGLRCCQQNEIVRQDLETATAAEFSWGECVVLFNEGKESAGRACVDQLRPPPPTLPPNVPKWTWPVATAEIALLGYKESQARRGAVASVEVQKCTAPGK